MITTMATKSITIIVMKTKTILTRNTIMVMITTVQRLIVIVTVITVTNIVTSIAFVVSSTLVTIVAIEAQSGSSKSLRVKALAVLAQLRSLFEHQCVCGADGGIHVRIVSESLAPPKRLPPDGYLCCFEQDQSSRRKI